ncbi:MAG: hypothetical protein WD024_03420 [Bacillota bacterium]
MANDRTRKLRWEHIALLVSVAWSLAYQYYVRVDCSAPSAMLQLHNEILSGTAPSPYRYRVLVPFLVDQVKTILHFLVPGREFTMAYRGYEVAALSFTLIALYTYFRDWFSDDRALLGSLIAAATMGLVFQDHYLQPWSLIEPGVLALGLHLVCHDKRLLLAVLIPLAAMNRETAVMIPLAYAAAHLAEEWRQTGVGAKIKVLLRAGPYFVEWAAVFYGLRLVRGSTPQIDSMQYLWSLNTQPGNVSLSMGRITMFLGVLWVFAFLGFWESPKFIQATGLIAPVYVGLTLVFALWWEVRLLMPLYAVQVSVCAFRRRKGSQSYKTSLSGPSSTS